MGYKYTLPDGDMEKFVTSGIMIKNKNAINNAKYITEFRVGG